MWWQSFFHFFCWNFSAHIYSYLEHILKFFQSKLLNYTPTWPLTSKNIILRWPRLQAFCLSKRKKLNGILICEIRTSIWIRIIKKCWKLDFRCYWIFFVIFGVFLRLLQHEKKGSMNQNYPSSACVYMTIE